MVKEALILDANFTLADGVFKQRIVLQYADGVKQPFYTQLNIPFPGVNAFKLDWVAPLDDKGGKYLAEIEGDSLKKLTLLKDD